MFDDINYSDNQCDQEIESETISKEFIPGAMGERITFLRKRKKLTQAQVAEQLGILAQAVSKWESGLSCPDIMMLVPLSQLFGVSTDVLLGVEEEKLIPPEEIREVIKDVVEDFIEGTMDDTRKSDFIKEQKKSQEEVIIETCPVIIQKNRERRDVHSISINLGACSIQLREGSEFSLKTQGYEKEDFISEVTDGVWIIRNKTDINKLFVLGWRFMDRKIVVTVPRDHKFQQIDINIGAGSFSGTGIHTEKSKLNCGAGEMKLYNFYSNNTVANCGMGQLEIQGELYGSTKLDCGMGTIKTVIKRPENYGYKASLTMGEIMIDGNKISGLGGSQTLNGSAENFYEVSCGMGEINIIFV